MKFEVNKRSVADFENPYLRPWFRQPRRQSSRPRVATSVGRPTPEHTELEMKPGLTITVALTLKPDDTDRFCSEVLPKILPQTRAFEGVRSFNAFRQSSDPSKVLFITVFDDAAAHETYIRWRTDRGDLAMIGSFLSEPAVSTPWPVEIQEA